MAIALSHLRAQYQGRQLAVKLHDLVRDEVQFGFTRRFDTATADETWSCKTGHCTPKTQLFVTLLRQAGFDDAKVVTVDIPNDVLRGLGGFPPRLQHCFTQVTIDGETRRVDSYIVDAPLFAKAQAKLQSQNQTAGYGIHRDGSCEWDGQSDSFSQYVEATHTPHKERVYDSTTQMLQQDNTYEHRGFVSVLSIWGVGPLFGKFFLEGSVNSAIEILREH